MAKIETLAQDIEKLLTVPHILSELAGEAFSKEFAGVLRRQLLKEQRNTFSLSQIGGSCDRELQYKLQGKVVGEDLSSSTRLKFMYGDLIEVLILLLAREAGHSVEGQQTELDIDGVKGHRDAIIDGMLVDVKSASSMSFHKFKNHLSKDEDSFNYLPQLGAYLFASQNDSLLINKTEAGFLVVDKQFGHICLDVHKDLLKQDFKAMVKRKQEVLRNPDLVPRAFFDELDGKSGNRKLGTKCSYCAFKRTCWPRLQVFNYSTGPRFLTEVVRVPDVPRGV